MNRIEDLERQLAICRRALADYRARDLPDDNPNIALILDQIKGLEERVRAFSGERIQGQAVERPV
jgi:hypothetical protein